MKLWTMENVFFEKSRSRTLQVDYKPIGNSPVKSCKIFLLNFVRKLVTVGE